MGAAAAFFLCDRGERDVLVLERDQLGSGTTKGGLGGIRHQFIDEVDIRMSQLGGASFREGVAVESLLREGDRVTGVRTAAGDIRAERVLIAAGCWTAALAATAAVPVPIWPYRRSIMQSGPVPQLARIPLTIERESGFHFRPKGAAQRFAMPTITTDGKEEKGPAGTPATFPGEFAPPEVRGSLEPWVRARAAWRHRAFARLEIVDSWSCYYAMPPDDHPIVGAVPGVAGLYIAAGFSGHGFMHAPATAQLVVEEMLDGRAHTIDIGDLSLERFGAGRRPFKAAVL